MALGTGSGKGPAGLVVSRAEDCSGGSPCPALPEGCVCVHRWALAAVRGGHRPSISGVCESGQGGGSVQAGGALPPAHCRPLAPRRAEAARLSVAQGSGRGLSLGFTAIARLRRKGWPGAPQTASCLSSVLGGEEEGAEAGPWQWGRGAVCLQVSPSSPARGQGAPPKYSLAWLLGVGSRSQAETPAQGGRCEWHRQGLPPRPTCRPGLRQRRGEQAGRAGPTDALSPSPRPDAGFRGSVDPGTGVRRARGSCAHVAGRGGRRAQISREGRSGGFRLGPAHTRVTGWMEAHTHVHKHRQTDVHTEATRGTGSAGTGGAGLAAACLPCVALPLPRQLARGPPSLGAHDLAGPRLVGSVWGQLGEHHLHGLELLVLGRDGAHLVGHLVAFHRHVLPLDAGGGRGVSAQERPPPWTAPVV